MKEEFLHHVWKYKLFDSSDLRTTDGRQMTVMNGGHHNHDAGPDFSQAVVTIDDIEWNGNVEIHIKASDWYRHQHQTNRAYDNVILHVVWEDDQSIAINEQNNIPCLELKDLVAPSLLQKYESLLLNKSWIACANNIERINIDQIKLWLHSIAVERLALKSSEILKDLELSTQHWERIFYKYLFRVFGLKVNQDAFSYLFDSVPFEKMIQISDNVFSLEALLFGQAGFLSEMYQDDYPKELLKEYNFLKHKYSIGPIARNYWKFARMRPANFPTIRIAQICQVLNKHKSLFQLIVELDIKAIRELFLDIDTSEYWRTHYRFDELSTEKRKLLGKNKIDVILINAVAPILFSYGKIKMEDKFIDKALALLDLIDAEKNSIITKWVDLGIKAETALDSQSLLHLKKHYCDHYKCIQCQIGVSIISTE